MSHTLVLFSRIINHLVFLSLYDDYGRSRSKQIETCEQLAEELNQVGVLTSKGNKWSSNSLECFFYRCTSKFSKEEILSCCDLELVGSLAWKSVIPYPLLHNTSAINLHGYDERVRRKNNFKNNDTQRH